MYTILCNPHITMDYHFRIFPCRQSACSQPAVSSHASAIASAQSATHAWFAYISQHLIQRINTQIRRPGYAACTQIKVVSSNQRQWRSSASGRESSTPSPTGHITNPTDLWRGRSDNSTRQPVLPCLPVTCQPTCCVRCTWLCAIPRTSCPVVRCSGS